MVDGKNEEFFKPHGVPVEEAVGGNPAWGFVLDQKPMEGSGKHPLAEIPPVVEKILRSGSNNGRKPFTVYPDFLVAFKESKSRTIPLHLEIDTEKVSVPEIWIGRCFRFADIPYGFHGNGACSRPATGLNPRAKPGCPEHVLRKKRQCIVVVEMYTKK